MTPTSLQVDIISPEKPLFSGTASVVIAPAHDGEVGILPHHAPMVAELGIGEVRIQSETLGGSHREFFAVSGGFIQTSGGKVIILTEIARAPSEIDPAKTAKELESIRAELESATSAARRQELNAKRKWCDTQIKVAAHTAK